MTLYTPRHNLEVTAGRKYAHCLTSECEGDRERTGHVMRTVNPSVKREEHVWKHSQMNTLVLTHDKPSMWFLFKNYLILPQYMLQLFKVFQPIQFERMLFLTIHCMSCWIGQNTALFITSFTVCVLNESVFYVTGSSLCLQGWSDMEAKEDTDLGAGNLHRHPCYYQSLSINTSKISIFKFWWVFTTNFYLTGQTVCKHWYLGQCLYVYFGIQTCPS